MKHVTLKFGKMQFDVLHAKLRVKHVLFQENLFSKDKQLSVSIVANLVTKMRGLNIIKILLTVLGAINLQTDYIILIFLII